MRGSFLRLGDRTRPVLLGAFTATCVVETALVSLQAWRGVPSHFNVATPFDASVARTLAAGGVVLVATIVILTAAAFRANPAVPVSLRVAIQIGFVALCGAVGVGALMIAKGMRLVFAGDPQSAYATGGIFKPTHAVTMHAILVLPMLYPFLRDRLGVDFLALGLSTSVLGVVSGLTQAPLGYVVVESRPRCLFFSTFHTFPEENTIIKSQTLIEKQS